jgi:ABC-type nitrate/sulfonate/bicarbonate transport system permease component
MAGVGTMTQTSLLSRVTRYRLIAALLLLGLWEAAGASGLFFKGVLPSTWFIGKSLLRLMGDPIFWGHFGVTLFEILSGFAIGSWLGLIAGLALGMNRYTGQVLEPVVEYLAATPKVVFLPILLILFGIGVGSKISLAALSCFFPMSLSLAAGVRGINPMFVRVGQTLNLTLLQRVRMIYLPALIPPISTGLRLGFGIATVGSLLSEIKLSNKGLGHAAMQAYARFDIPTMMAILIVIFALAGIGNKLIGRIIRLPGPNTRRIMKEAP